MSRWFRQGLAAVFCAFAWACAHACPPLPPPQHPPGWREPTEAQRLRERFESADTVFTAEVVGRTVVKSVPGDPGANEERYGLRPMAFYKGRRDTRLEVLWAFPPLNDCIPGSPFRRVGERLIVFSSSAAPAPFVLPLDGDAGRLVQAWGTARKP